MSNFAGDIMKPYSFPVIGKHSRPSFATRRRDVLTVATALILVPCLAQSQGPSSDALFWLAQVSETAIPVLSRIYKALLSTRNRAALEDAKKHLARIRRDLAAATPIRNVQTKFERWLVDYDSYTDNLTTSADDPRVLAERKRVEEQLKEEWSDLRRTCVDALQQIEILGAEMDKLDPGAMDSNVWLRYKELLRQEKNMSEFLNSPVPTDPHSIQRIRNAGLQLRHLVEMIDENAVALDQVLERAG
jgi:hypothetical protein